MPSTVAETLRLLNVSPLGADMFEGAQPASSCLHKVYGGQVAAQLLAAATQTVPADRQVHHLQVNFLLPGDWSEPIRCQVDRVRDGGSFSARLMTAWQGERRIATASASYQRLEPGFDHAVACPDVRGPEESADLFEVAGRLSNIPAEQWRAEFGAFEMRLAEVELSGTTTAPRAGAQKIWFRFRAPAAGTVSWETLLFTYISDFSFLGAALTAHGIFLGAEEVHRATLNHAIWYHGMPRPHEWFLYDQQSHWAGGGRGLVTAKVFACDGELIATTSQEGLIRPLGALRQLLDLP